MTSKETLCSGCGATVKQMGNGLWFDLAGFIICEKGDADDCHYVNPALPPVAIAPEPQRTPGPWRYDVQNHQIRTGQPTDRRFSGELIASVSPLNPEMIANARFIVQACNSHDDMLAALKAAQLELLQSRPSEYSEEILGIIDAAISRAEGGKQ